ncbi:hypothetical protein I302_104868 [Kwoniella bestiolae CBS 10118]|uniref:NmrA-like domain-containing protein n=1 Tax=Kwoniella bestiolae CBS 10118 TaxID=1296100 RepID=A0A1B9FRJ0_9TREE|nr:hypothetical protein I302_09062 [Kwoniella bestiolae CBS 10118]OCF21385.1 hypothetical protein I302_09062 [Kwoniella bestiolae CBS 10118]
MQGENGTTTQARDGIVDGHSSDKKKFVVFTATGDQGESVCRYLLKDGQWDVIGITRNVSSEGAKELDKLGVRVVQGDMEDPSSYARYLKGAYGAFVNADFWAPYYASSSNPSIASETEYKHSKNAIDECIKAELKHVVYSTLDDLGEDGIPHFDSKANVSKYIRTTSLPTTHLITSYYFSNAIKFGQIKRDKHGTLLLATPAPDDCPIPGYAVEQTGAWVLKALNEPDKFIGKTIYACSDILTVSEMASTLTDVAEAKFDTLGLTREEFYSDGFRCKNDKELWLNFELFYRKLAKRDVQKSKELAPEQWSFREWAEQNHEFRKVAGI